MSEQLKPVVAVCSKRYNENRRCGPGLARAHLANINRANDVMLTTGQLDDLLDSVSKRQTDSDLAKACKEVLEQIGTASGS
jgi:hypothetical protein